MKIKEYTLRFLEKFPFLYRLGKNLRDGKQFMPSVRKTVKGEGNTLRFANTAVFRNCELIIIGNHNAIEISQKVLMNNVKIYIKGNNNRLSIGEHCEFRRSGEIWMEDAFCELTIGPGTTFEETHVALTEDRSKITIGKGCMFANGIDVRTGDSHSIIESDTKKRINKAQNVVIGNHVWVGAHTSILKGSIIPDDTVVGTRSVVTGIFQEPGSIIAGIPAQVKKRNINWLRERI